MRFTVEVRFPTSEPCFGMRKIDTGDESGFVSSSGVMIDIGEKSSGMYILRNQRPTATPMFSCDTVAQVAQIFGGVNTLSG